MDEHDERALHWADSAAEKIIRERGEKQPYVCASGITPSGTVHIGNFREIISVELVVRALRDRRKTVRFIYSWDDYDVFRKVPDNMPNRDELAKYLRMPITMVPDPHQASEPATSERNYARSNEREIEALLPLVGVHPEYLYQAERYRSSLYAAGIRTALEKRDAIRAILDEHRTEPLPSDWLPVSIFCTRCNHDSTTIEQWDEAWALSYRCTNCGNAETVDLRKSGAVKLLWRVDWPMRWKAEGVDFEPAGKDHHSEGGSFDTAKRIVQAVYDGAPPVTFQYDFIGIKGMGGKISSSHGEVISLREVLEVYQPEVVRYLFAGPRPNTEFAISFDLDVIKIYEDYDKTERIYFGKEEVEEKRRQKEARIYELSQVAEVPKAMALQVPFRHLCNLLQIHLGDIDRVVDELAASGEGSRGDEGFDVAARERLRVRARCAWSWITKHAPADFRFSLRTPEEAPVALEEGARRAVSLLRARVERLDSFDEKSLADELYTIAGEAGIDPKELFKASYRVLIGAERGPRLASFILTVGKERVLALLAPY